MSALIRLQSLDRRALMRGGLFVSGLVLAGCSTEVTPPRREPAEPSFYRLLNRVGAEVDAEMAASMISGYRGNNGRGGLSVDENLMRLARQKAAAMAAVDSVAAGSGNLPAGLVENTSAGYLTLAEAFSGWRDSPPHRAAMLNGSVRKLGIATAYRPGSKYRVFWALVLAP